MFDFAIAYPFAVGACLLPALWISIIAHHYRDAISQRWKVLAAGCPFIGSIASIKRQPGCVQILNPEDAIPVTHGERSLVTQFIDPLTPRLTPEQWHGVATFLVRSGDSELPQLLRAPPIRKLGEITIIFVESYAVSLLLTPTLSIWVTPEQVPLIAAGASVVLAAGLTAVLARGGTHARLYETFRAYMREYASDPQSGNPRPKPIGWRDDQSSDDHAPSYQMGLSRLHARGNPLWIAAAMLSAVVAVGGATGMRYALLEQQAELDAQHSRQIQQLSEAQPPAAQASPRESQTSSNEFALGLFLLTFSLGAMLTYVGTKERTALGRDVHGLLHLTRNCTSFDEEAALLRRNYAMVSQALSRLQREMPPFARRRIPTLHDVMSHIGRTHGPTSPASAVNVAQLTTRHAPAGEIHMHTGISA